MKRGEPKNVEWGSQQKRGGRREKKRKDGRKKRREEERRFGNLVSIEPLNRSRSISNFDITFYSTPETTGWFPIEISMVGFS